MFWAKIFNSCDWVNDRPGSWYAYASKMTKRYYMIEIMGSNGEKFENLVRDV